MAKVEMPKFKKVGKVGYASASKHKALSLVAARAKLKVLTTHRTGSGTNTTVRQHGAKDLRAKFGLPAVRKGSAR